LVKDYTYIKEEGMKLLIWKGLPCFCVIKLLFRNVENKVFNNFPKFNEIFLGFSTSV